MRWDLFHKSESNTKPLSEIPCKVWTFDLPESATLIDALETARIAGMPRGSARGGCVEVQNDLGIYRRIGGGRIDLSTPRKAAKVEFKTWEQLEAEEN